MCKVALNPSLVEFFAEVTGKLRWDEAQIVPQAQVFLLLWKSILLVFGGSRELAETKRATRENPSDAKDDRDVITASPLDYHVFRQEITSKYPAYIPPQPAIPLEAENTSLLPPLPSQQARNNGAQGILPPQPGTQAGGASILHQPVHIATPAPSPPPSPGVGGKGVKKQNYQTNQNFPFMYPPLDESSNSLGGKGNTALQDLLVTRKWEGGDVPASILEAGELFSNRVRMTRAARQLWQERERFIKFERGWDESTNDILDELDLSSLTLEEKEELGLVKPKEPEPEEVEVDFGPRKDLDDRTKQRLNAVERFYVSDCIFVAFCVGLTLDTGQHSPHTAIDIDDFDQVHHSTLDGRDDTAATRFIWNARSKQRESQRERTGPRWLKRHQWYWKR